MPGFGDAMSAWGAGLTGQKDEKKDSKDPLGDPTAAAIKPSSAPLAAGPGGVGTAPAASGVAANVPAFLAALSDKRAKRDIKRSPNLDAILGRLKEYRSK